MNPKLLEGLAGKLSERVVAAVVSPAFTFLGIGLVAWLWSRGWTHGWTELMEWAGQRTTGEAVLMLVAGLLLVLAIGSLVNAVSVPVIRFLEGYWPRPLAPLARRLKRRQERIFCDLDLAFQRFAAAALAPDAGERSRWEATRAEDDLARFPVAKSLLLPTRLGNTLRASELRPFYKYGFDPVRCWYQLWLVLPDSTRSEIVAARTRLDDAASAFTFSVALAVWTVFAWWALPLAILAAAVCYQVYAIPAAHAYGDVVEAACDVHRTTLFSALRLVLPESPLRDHEVATFVNGYLQRGANTAERIFLTPN